jgi:hypothetical protein
MGAWIIFFMSWLDGASLRVRPSALSRCRCFVRPSAKRTGGREMAGKVKGGEDGLPCGYSCIPALSAFTTR